MEIKLLEPSDNTRAYIAAITRVSNPSKIEKKFYSGTGSSEKVINAIDGYDHFSTREFTPLIFLVEGTSRVLSFLLMLKSIYSTFEQQSQRYVIIKSRNVVNVPEEIVNLSIDEYNELIKNKIPREDARFVIPQGIYTNFGMYTNAREIENLIKIFSKKKYPDEVYETLEEIIEVAKQKYPKSMKKVEEEYYNMQIKNKEYVKFKIKNVEESPKLEIDRYEISDFEDLEKKLKFSRMKGTVSFSTAAAHQFIRHRRIVKEVNSMGNGYITPGSIKKNKSLKEGYKSVIEEMFDVAKEENSQYILPNAAVTEIYFSETFEHLIDNFIPLRTCLHAQWEIREIADKEKKLLEKKLGFEIPYCRRRLYLRRKGSPLEEDYPTRPCPEGDEKCPLYSKSLNSTS